MTLQNETIENIKENFELNHYEVKIWTSLLSKGIAAASELADISGVPRSRCYDVLESLEKKGFTIMKIGKPIEYIAVEPEEVLERIKKRIKHESELNIKLLSVIRESDIFHELELLHKTGIEHVEPEDVTDTFNGKADINKQIKEMVENSKKSLTIVTTKHGFEKLQRVLKNILPKKVKSGLKVRFIAPVSYEDIKGKEFKVISIQNELRYILCDNKSTLIYLTPEGTESTMERSILIKSEFFCNVLEGLYGG